MTSGGERSRVARIPRGWTWFTVLLATVALCGFSSLAEASIDTARAAVEHAGSATERVPALWQLADAEVAVGNLSEAASVLREAAALASSPQEKTQTALRLGILLTASGDIDGAAPLLAQVEAAGGSLSAQQVVQLRIAQGGLAARSGDFTKAERDFDAATAAADAASMPFDKSRAELNALRARMDRVELAGLDERLSRTDAGIRQLPRGEAAATLLIGMGELFRRAINEFQFPTGLRRAAHADFTAARACADADATRAQALGFLGALYEDERRWPDALELTLQAVFLAQSTGDAEQLYRWEWQVARVQRQQGDLLQSEQAMYRALHDLAGVQSDVLRGSRRAFRSLVEPVYLDYADINLRRAASLPEGDPEQQRVLRNVRNQLESLKQAEVQDYFDSQCAANDTGATGTFNFPGTAVLYPVLLPDRLEVLVESGGVLRRFATPVSRGEVTFAARQLRLALQRPTSGDAYAPSARSLYGWIVKPAQAWLESQKVQTLVFVPSGALRTVPLAALNDGQHFLIEQFAVATTPAMSFVLTPRDTPIERMLLGGLTKSVQGFDALPSVAQELRTVAAMYPNESMQDESFQLAAVRAELAAPAFSAAHLATHGEFNADYRRSFVLTYDSRLTMAGLKSALDGRAQPLDLLVLSACQTAAGDDRAALGLAGVAIQAGVKSALASLWNISDPATAELMARFYESAKTESKAQSLQHAQIALLKSTRFSHPAYWAPYLLIGSWL
jgi:CHAT domain-containing protein/predicted negative regulator of RcsB-dependent stress response